jgi:1-deoxyxylulose-5-phosphate synthase
VDLYQIHRWDYQTPIEETVEALHEVVRAGEARDISVPPPCSRGSSRRRCTSPRSMAGPASSRCKDHLNLIYREEERKMLPLCREEQIGLIPYSPLASGRLTRDRSWLQGLLLTPMRAKAQLTVASSCLPLRCCCQY